MWNVGGQRRGEAEDGLTNVAAYGTTVATTYYYLSKIWMQKQEHFGDFVPKTIDELVVANDF